MLGLNGLDRLIPIYPSLPWKQPIAAGAPGRTDLILVRTMPLQAFRGEIDGMSEKGT